MLNKLNFSTRVTGQGNPASDINQIAPLLDAIVDAINYVPLIIFNGESNSGGRALNSSASSAEKLPMPAVQILNNTSLQFEALQIGVNNNIGHLNDSDITSANSHGWELELALRVNAGAFGGKAYLVKTGQGGSSIFEWAVDSTSTAKPYFAKFQERVTAAMALLRAQGLVPVPIIFYSQGINDRTSNPAIWKQTTLQHFKNMRKVLGTHAPVIFTDFTSPEFDAPVQKFSIEVADIALFDSWSYRVSTADIPSDGTHWLYAAMKTLTDKMVDVAQDYLKIGPPKQYVLNQTGQLGQGLRRVPNTQEMLLGPVKFNINTAIGATQPDGQDYLLCTDGNGQGATSADWLDPQKDFEVVASVEGNNQNIVVVSLTATQAQNFSFSAANRMIGGMFHKNDGGTLTLNIIPNLAGVFVTPTPPTPPYFVKMKKYNYDLLLQVRSDGVTYSTVYTQQNCLQGAPFLLVRVTFSIDASSSKKVKVTRTL